MKKHPATYTNKFLPIFAELLKGTLNVLDIFAGSGKLALIKKEGYTGEVYCNELEPEWVESSTYPVDHWVVGDASNISAFEDGFFEAICTSPTYGNRMADHHNAKDESKRITYKHYLGRDLGDENTGRMQWGEKYKNKHLEVYKECFRLLKIKGFIIINVSNHIRKGVEVEVVGWHKEALTLNGFVFKSEIKIDTPRMGFGANAKKRVSSESILIFDKC